MRRYSSSHEWVTIDGDIATCGISDHAQQSLGDVVFVEMPEVGDEVEAGAACAEIESVKAVSDIYAPISGTITEVNEALEDTPETVNADPLGAGWLFRIAVTDDAATNQLQDEAAYLASTSAG